MEAHFRYCCSVRGSCGATTFNELQNIQNKAVRLLAESIFEASLKPQMEHLSIFSFGRSFANFLVKNLNLCSTNLLLGLESVVKYKNSFENSKEKFKICHRSLSFQRLCSNQGHKDPGVLHTPLAVAI